MRKKNLKVAVVGAGYWGKNLVRVFSGLGALGAVCDTNPERLERLKQEYPGVDLSLSFTDILNRPSINAMVISTPAETHYNFAKQALLAKKDVFVEKPLALISSQGAELVKLAHEMKRVLMVGHLLEYHPAVLKLKEFVQKGELGKIQYVYSNRLNLGKIRREENILWSFAPHDISAVLSLLNEVPETVSSSGGNYLHHQIADVTLSTMSFASGVKAHIFVSWLHPYKEQKLIVVGDKKMAVFDDVAQNDKLLLYSHKIDWVERVPVPKKENAEKVEFSMEEPLLAECRHFMECLRSRKSPRTDGESALKVLRVLQACQESLEKNGASVHLKASEKEASFYAHPSAQIDEPCEIEEGTSIWHFSHIMKGASIGKNCRIGQNVFIGSKASLGNNVKVQNNVSVYDCVHIEDGVFCGPSAVFTNVFNPRSHIERKDEYMQTRVKKGATIGANATIVCGNTIGAYAFIGAGAVVTSDVPDFALAYGNPAKIKGWVCSCGVKLEIEDNKAVCGKCKNNYTLRENNLRQA